MINQYLLTSSFRRLGPIAAMLLGDVCPGAWKIGRDRTAERTADGAAVGGRAP